MNYFQYKHMLNKEVYNKRFMFCMIMIFIHVYSYAQHTPLSIPETIVFKQNVSVVAQQSKTIINAFTQIKHIDFLSNDIESKGNLYFKAPNIIKWSYTVPYIYSVIFKQGKLYINDGGKKNTINLASNKVFKKLNDLIAKSVSGDLLDKNQFTITAYENKKDYTAVLIPKDKTLGDLFKEIILTFTKTTLRVSKVKLTEPSGDYTLIIFDTISINKPISDAIFTH